MRSISIGEFGDGRPSYKNVFFHSSPEELQACANKEAELVTEILDARNVGYKVQYQKDRLRRRIA